MLYQARGELLASGFLITRMSACGERRGVYHLSARYAHSH